MRILKNLMVFFLSVTFLYGAICGPIWAADLPRVVIVATGGTIAMKIDPSTGGPVPALSGEDLVSAVPELNKLAQIEVVNFSNIPSDYMDPERWINLSKKVDEVFKMAFIFIQT